ncbi:MULTISPECIES: SGNH/GDSL hydrolase family protein [Oceanobacillus]|uniref:Hydrolase n=1 Tax=Oceanobacillus profundus TaxID=372463 RepID=A0A417YB01_9BACI|nr:SGNH/GDSL hydrolase family protein [Oceanobacillus profundus]MBR3118294.1 SGNH/GDSL hydrolase family protein [Oceanobacillus sp.]MDO6449376.1 SGNH/GDSL hydrolase family protein [Oceanobacillus profundus]PAE28732.1 hydrolase [Paenibacillus sp. 7884-2]RHW29687.1 hydrolase [Oceanobacillus profundus]
MNKKRILFIGDSITESGLHEDKAKLGTGYVRIIHDYLQAIYPNSFEVFNKGISGNRVIDLEERWDKDVLKCNPEILSISIGVNDVWRQLDNPGLKQIYPEEFASIYNELLMQAREETNATLVLMEPTLIEEELNSAGNEKLKIYVEIVRRLADKHRAILIPTHQDFIDYVMTNSGYPLTIDGVHMNSVGNMLMANSWIKSVIPTLK